MKENRHLFKSKVLLLVQLPPPIHGVSMMNSHIVNSETINENFDINIIDLKFTTLMGHLQKFSVSKIIKAIKYCFEIIKKMLVFKPQLVYFTFMPTGFGFYRDAFYVFILKMFDTKILLHLHGKGIKNESNRFFNRFLYKFVFHNTFVICLSEILSKDISDVFKGNPFIVQNGVPEHPFRRTFHSTKCQKIIQILYLSNYTINKGIFELVKALGILKDKGYNFNVKFVGAPFDVTSDELKVFIDKQNLTSVAEVIGPLNGNDKFLEFQRADLFIFPTYNDAFPLVIIEAMQFGLPVISTFEGGIPDIVINNETAILVEPQNLRELVDKIAYVLDNSYICDEMGKKGYERYKKNFTLNQFIENINKTFQEILDLK